MKNLSMIAALASATVSAAAGSASAQGYRVQGANEGAGTASIRPAGEGPSSATGAAGAAGEGDATVAITGRGANGAVNTRRERAWWEYAGVTPGSAEMTVLRRWARRPRRDGRVVVAWPGFQMTESGSRLFLAVSSVPTMTPINEPGRLVYRLANASVPLSNNRRALETVAFATPVTRAYLRARRGSVDLVIELRASGVQPVQSQRPGPEGVSFVILEFPRYSLPEPADNAGNAGAGPSAGQGAGQRSNGPPSEPRRATISNASTSPGTGSASIRPSSEGSAGNGVTGATGADDERPPPVIR